MAAFNTPSIPLPSVVVVPNNETVGGTLAVTGATTLAGGLNTPLVVAQGGSGVGTHTAYGVLTGGTTATGAEQTVTPGTAGLYLTSGGSASLPTWAQGKVVQIVTATVGAVTSSSTSTYVDTNLTATITPTSASNKVLVFVSQNGVQKNTGNTGAGLRLVRDAITVQYFAYTAGYNGTVNESDIGSCSLAYMDAPATTSATVYKTQFASTYNITSVIVSHNNDPSFIVLMEVTP